jgi:putative ABC transport system permease protein
MAHTPPRFAKQILHRFCYIGLLEEFEGDLDEQFYQHLNTQGSFKAKIFYYLEVLRIIRAVRIRRNRISAGTNLSFGESIHHFLKITRRNLWRSKSSSFINLIGLSLSLMSFLFIYLFVVDESTYDAFHPNAENVYRISYTYLRYGDGIQETDARAAGLWVMDLKESFPEVKRYTRFSRFGYPGYVKYEKENKIFIEQQFFWTDANYTDIFSLPLIGQGDAKQILGRPNAVIVNETVARKYFGESNPIGQVLIYSRDGMDFHLTVEAVMKNYPSNAHFHPDFIASNQTLNPLWKRNNEDRINSGGDSFTYSFIELEEGTNLSKILGGLQQIFKRYLGDLAKTASPVLTKLTDIHFTPGMLVELEPTGDRVYIYIFSSIGFLILFIAAINYMNLATARSIKRSKEVGLRKALGGSKATLIIQFLGESFLITSIAFLLAIIYTVILLPYFNEVTSKSFSFDFLLDLKILPPLFFLIVALAIVAGSYPAFYLSKFKAIEVLKGKFSVGKGSENFRRVLVVFQFSVTLLLIVGTIVIQRQLSFISAATLSEHKDEILTVRLAGVASMDKIESFRQAARLHSSVSAVALGNHLPRHENFGWIDRAFAVPTLGETPHIWQQFGVDAAFSPMFNLEFIAGRNFSNSPADSNAYIVNEQVVRDLGLTPDKVLGLELESKGYQSHNQKGAVIGVVKDFNYSSVRKHILPLVVSGRHNDAETLYIKMEGNNYGETLAYLEKAWKQIYPSAPFQYWFMNEEFERLYQLEMRMGKVFSFFAGFTIIIACLGLFGLASFTAEQKTKEVGIRKVLGASPVQILILLTTRFVKLIVIAFLLAIPAGFLGIEKWLTSFAYHIDIDWLIFLWSGLFILFLTYVVVGIESLRAALTNPVDTIRYE